MKKIFPQRGEIWLVNFDPQIGKEIMKQRPAIVLTIPDFYSISLRYIVPIKNYQEKHSYIENLITIEPNKENNLSKKSSIDCSQCKSFSYDRFVKKIGVVDEKLLNEIASMISFMIGY